MHFPTDINLLYDAIRKTIECCAQISNTHALKGWRQSAFNLRHFKKSYRTIQKLKHSTSKDESLRAVKQQEIRCAHKSYLEEAWGYLQRAHQTRVEVLALPGLSLCDVAQIASLDDYRAHAERQIDQIRRRVLAGEKIPHNEKVFSIFEPHTEWISKGKAGVPVELACGSAFLKTSIVSFSIIRLWQNRQTTR